MQSVTAGLPATGWLQRPLQTDLNSRSVAGMRLLQEAEDQHCCCVAVGCAAGGTAYKVIPV